MLQKLADPHSNLPYPRVFWQSAFSTSYRLACGYSTIASNLPMTYTSTWFGCQGFEPGKGWFFQPQETQEEAHFPLRPRALPSILSRIDNTSFEDWKLQVTTALEHIQKGLVTKVVLARSTTLLLNSPVSPWNVLAKLRERHHPSTTLFLVQRSPATSFVGATPEKLYERKGAQLLTMALAGTSKRSEDPEALLVSKKDRHEAAVVQRELAKILQTLCLNLSYDETPSILDTGTLYHLHYRLRGELRPDVSDRYLLQLLHPTPALGGAPRAAALRLIKTLETFRRGWYGAPLGWFSQDEADVAIGIRSAMIQGNKIHLYAGAGIVAGSEPEKEWEELDAKIAGFLQLWREE